MDLWQIVLAAATQGGGAAGETLGPELVTNGDFSVGTDWTFGTYASISGGKLLLRGETNDDIDSAQQAIAALASAATYRFVYTISGFSGAGISPNLGGVDAIARTANGTYSEDILVVASNDVLAFNAVYPTDADIDNVSVKEVL